MTLPKNSNNIATLSKRLSVQVSLTGLSFLTTELTSGKPVFFSEVSFSEPCAPEEILVQLKKAVNSNSALTEDVAKVSLTYATDMYTVVPAVLYQEEKASEYLKFNSKILATDFIASDSVENYGLMVVFVPFMNINNYLFETFGSFEYYHNTSLLLKLILDIEKFSKNPKVYLHVQQEHIDCIALNDGTLQLCNTFPYKTEEDLIYYVLFCLEQLKLNPDSIEVVCLGSIKKEDSIYSLLFKYIRNLSLFKPDERAIYPVEGELPHNHIALKLIS